MAAGQKEKKTSAEKGVIKADLVLNPQSEQSAILAGACTQLQGEFWQE